MIVAAAFVAFTWIMRVSRHGTIWQAVSTPIPWLFATICGTAGFVIRENNVNFDNNVVGRVFQ